MILKVGDKFKVVDKKVGNFWDTDGKMNKWLGKIMTVRVVYIDCDRPKEYYYKAVEDTEDCNSAYGWTWYPETIDWEVTEKLNK